VCARLVVVADANVLITPSRGSGQVGMVGSDPRLRVDGELLDSLQQASASVLLMPPADVVGRDVTVLLASSFAQLILIT
jgi:hypothetical protein